MTNDHAHTLAIFAHELREPLSSILLAAHTLGEKISDGLTHREMSDVIQRQGRYLARLIDGALEGGRRGEDQLCLHKKWFDLVPVVLEAAEAVTSMVRSSNHRLDLSVPPGPLYLLADPLRVQQVLVNLLANAAKYTPPGGSVGLRVEAGEDHVVIEILDNGVGMPMALVERVFDLFTQGETSGRFGGYTGLGVGLALVKALVEAHGGVVQAASDGVGAGSRFTVRLPFVDDSMPSKRAAATVARRVPAEMGAGSLSPMLDA